MFKQEDPNFVLSSSMEFTDQLMQQYLNNVSPVMVTEFTELDQMEIMNPENSIILEETMDVAHKFMEPKVEFHPITPIGPPETSTIIGDYNFVVEINGSDTRRRKYIYSHKLNRIYLDMKCNFSVHFNWEPTCPARFVRATVVFSSRDQAEKPVTICKQHDSENGIKNVLQSAREPGAAGVYYCGGADAWHSVVVRLRPPAAHAYLFVCKNSCTSGINRRAIDVVFTLEDEGGVVYGRQSVGARVCSCPKRDISKDEETEGVYISGKKRVASNQITPPPVKLKKIKLETVPNPPAESEDPVLTLPPLKLKGTRTLITGLEVMMRMMEQTADFKKHDQKALEEYNEYIQNFKTTIEKLKEQ